jgi:hypothetical protein
MDDLLFGTKQNFQLVPMPERGVQRRNVSAGEAGTLASGGGFASPSYGRHLEYEFDFAVREAHGAAGLDVFQEYATGLWNDFTAVVDGFNPNNLIYFLDPMNAEQNLFAPHFAAPMLSLSGDWPSIGTYVSDAATAANSYRQPPRTVTFSVTHASATLPAETRRKMVIPIPPGYTLRWGWSGASTGTGVVRHEAHNRSTGAIVAANAAALSATASTRLNQSINGDTYDYVTIGIARTSSAASTVAITSMLAVLHPNAESPALTGSHARGMGVTGCVFSGDGMPEDYYLVHEPAALHLKGLSFGLMEIGGWLWD